jgi:hypothetical protein
VKIPGTPPLKRSRAAVPAASGTPVGIRRPQAFPLRVDTAASLWRRLANLQLAATLLSAAYVYFANSRGTAAASDATIPVGVRLLATTFRTVWSYYYVRYFLAPSVNRVLSREPRSRARRLGASLLESLWAQLIDALFFWAIGAEVPLSTLPFVVTNTASVFLSAEASAAGYPPDRAIGFIEARLRSFWRRWRHPRA